MANVLFTGVKIRYPRAGALLPKRVCVTLLTKFVSLAPSEICVVSGVPLEMYRT